MPTITVISRSTTMEESSPQPTGVTVETTAQAQVQILPQDEVDFAADPDHKESSTISSGDDAKKQETKRQAWFENVIKKELKIPNSYVHVAPLIIRWASEVDDYDPGHTDEVNYLPFGCRRQSKSTCLQATDQ